MSDQLQGRSDQLQGRSDELQGREVAFRPADSGVGQVECPTQGRLLVTSRKPDAYGSVAVAAFATV